MVLLLVVWLVIDSIVQVCTVLSIGFGTFFRCGKSKALALEVLRCT